MRVLIADDHSILRQGLAALLDAAEGIELVGQASDGDELWSLAVKFNPDIVVMDVSMPGKRVTDFPAAVARQGLRARVIALTMHEEPAVALPVVQSGVAGAGYVLKRSAFDELTTAIRAVAAGGRYISPELAHALLNAPTELDTDPSKLSPRERDVLKCLAAGQTLKRIARDLSISERTVETYRARLLEKLSASTTADLIRYAERHHVT